MVLEVIQSSFLIKELYSTPEFEARVLGTGFQQEKITVVDNSDLKKISQLKNAAKYDSRLCNSRRKNASRNS